MFAAMGSCASILHVQEKSSACVEVLRKFAKEISTWFGLKDYNRRHTEVSVDADIMAICLDLSVSEVHTLKVGRKLKVKSTSKKAASTRKKPVSAVRDVLLEGMQILRRSVPSQMLI